MRPEISVDAVKRKKTKIRISMDQKQHIPRNVCMYVFGGKYVYVCICMNVYLYVCMYAYMRVSKYE